MLDRENKALKAELEAAKSTDNAELASVLKEPHKVDAWFYGPATKVPKSLGFETTAEPPVPPAADDGGDWKTGDGTFELKHALLGKNDLPPACFGITWNPFLPDEFLTFGVVNLTVWNFSEEDGWKKTMGSFGSTPGVRAALSLSSQCSLQPDC
ncbi:hypothetical protein CYMTET_18241 [Cymbomonas tetramitiformis]|uniref:Uncharacterized protein n=1 Tax=Cymbomonas tetramitiformis TaxID=36881 RepID=A0AAE0G8N5_9CHLO|nr:hypothetical protein CYMTET_18241 [Cymbomonas tetramitiformis]